MFPSSQTLLSACALMFCATLDLCPANEQEPKLSDCVSAATDLPEIIQDGYPGDYIWGPVAAPLVGYAAVVEEGELAAETLDSKTKTIPKWRENSRRLADGTYVSATEFGLEQFSVSENGEYEPKNHWRRWPNTQGIFVLRDGSVVFHLMDGNLRRIRIKGRTIIDGKLPTLPDIKTVNQLLNGNLFLTTNEQTPRYIHLLFEEEKAP